jgi:hypothetical protein
MPNGHSRRFRSAGVEAVLAVRQMTSAGRTGRSIAARTPLFPQRRNGRSGSKFDSPGRSCTQAEVEPSCGAPNIHVGPPTKRPSVWMNSGFEPFPLFPGEERKTKLLKLK